MDPGFSSGPKIMFFVQRICLPWVAKCCPYNSQVMHKWCQVVSNRLPCSERVSGIGIGIGIDIFISNAKLGDIF